jgi:hypothetical protein
MRRLDAQRARLERAADAQIAQQLRPQPQIVMPYADQEQQSNDSNDQAGSVPSYTYVGPGYAVDANTGRVIGPRTRHNRERVSPLAQDTFSPITQPPRSIVSPFPSPQSETTVPPHSHQGARPSHPGRPLAPSHAAPGRSITISPALPANAPRADAR